jgi:Zn-dependent M28 family amino/carboxypeptidase
MPLITILEQYEMQMFTFIMHRPHHLAFLFFCVALRAGAVDIADSAALRQKLTVEGIRGHQNELQQIARRNGGTRVAGGQGYQASAVYVQNRMLAAGYEVRMQEFPFSISEDNSAPVLLKTSPEPSSFVPDTDFANMSSMGYADIEAQIEAVDLLIPSPAPNQSTSGCDKEDFENFQRGNIALIQRGTCTFQTKVENALLAGAVGVIIFNEGNPGRTELISSRLNLSFANYPVMGATFEVGETLRASLLNGPTGINARMRIDVLVKEHIVRNVIAESAAGDPNRVLVIGAHLDSVRAGPGINDNGSGSATNLEIAEKVAELGLVPKNKLRFIWFAAEEFGLLGSEFYVNSLSGQERQHILAMLNFDMLGSSNYVRFVYDGDNSAKSALNAQSGPDGSGYIEKIFLDYFSSLQLPSHPTAFDGRSDYGPFIEVGIPAGGLFSGAEGLKSAELARIYGGVARSPFDPCYHRACDDFEHTGQLPSSSLALKSIDELSDAAAHAVIRLSSFEGNLRRSQPLAPVPAVEFEYRGNLLLK